MISAETSFMFYEFPRAVLLQKAYTFNKHALCNTVVCAETPIVFMIVAIMNSAKKYVTIPNKHIKMCVLS